MNTAIRCTASFVFLCSTVQVATAQPGPAFHFNFTQAPGPYAVGLNVVEQYDRSRRFRVESDLPSGPLAATVMFAGQVISGGVVSTTLTVMEMVAVFPWLSGALQLTELWPSGKSIGAAGTQVTVADPSTGEYADNP